MATRSLLDPSSRPRATGAPTRHDGGVPKLLVERARPVTMAGDRVVPVLPALSGLFPDGGLRRGSTVVVDPAAGCGRAGVSLAAALLAGASQAGLWGGVLGLGEIGLAAAAGLGVDLSRLALVPSPGGEWARVSAALLDAVDVVLLSPPAGLKAGEARRLVARARERGSVLVIRGGRAHRGPAWPELPDLRLVPLRAEWQGLGKGHGMLRARMVEVEASGRGAAARPRRMVLWLPGEDGRVEAVERSAGHGVVVEEAAGPVAAVEAAVGAAVEAAG